MGEFQLEGKLGVDTVSQLRDCCIDTILSWRPQTLGQKHKCLFCDNPMKTIQAGEVADPEWTGMLNETRLERSSPELGLAELWFSKKRYSDLAAVQEWCNSRGIEASDVRVHDMAFSVPVSKIVGGTGRVVWGGRGVLSVFGITKMTTDGMATGGMLHPHQGAVDEEPKEDAEKEEVSEDSCDEEKSCAEKVMSNFESSLNKMLP